MRNDTCLMNDAVKKYNVVTNIFSSFQGTLKLRDKGMDQIDERILYRIVTLDVAQQAKQAGSALCQLQLAMCKPKYVSPSEST